MREQLGELLHPILRLVSYWSALLLSLAVPLIAFVFSFSHLQDVAHRPSTIEKALLDSTGSSDWTFVLGSAGAVLAVTIFFALFHLVDGRGAIASTLRFEAMRKLFNMRSGGLLVPSMVSAGLFFLALLAVAVLYKESGTAVKEFDFAKAVREVFPLYLALMSVLAVVQLYYESNRMTYGVHEFLDAVARDLRSVEKESGRVQFTLQWLAVGQMSVPSDVFEKYRKAFRDCCDAPNVEMQVKAKKWNDIEAELNCLQALQPDLAAKIDAFRQAEFDLRWVSYKPHRNCTFSEVRDEEFADFGAIIFPNCIYFVYIDSTDARSAGSVTQDFIAIRIVDSEACRRFAALLAKGPLQPSAAIGTAGT